jgi:hypothetical protein
MNLGRILKSFFVISSFMIPLHLLIFFLGFIYTDSDAFYTSLIHTWLSMEFLMDSFDYFIPILSSFLVSIILLKFFYKPMKTKKIKITWSILILFIILYPLVFISLLAFTYTLITNEFNPHQFITFLIKNSVIGIFVSVTLSLIIHNMLKYIQNFNANKAIFRTNRYDVLLIIFSFSLLFSISTFFSYPFPMHTDCFGTTQTISELSFNDLNFSLPTPFLLNILLSVLIGILLSFSIKYFTLKFNLLNFEIKTKKVIYFSILMYVILVSLIFYVRLKNNPEVIGCNMGLPNPPTYEHSFTVAPQILNLSSTSNVKFLFAYMSKAESDIGEECKIRLCKCDGCNNPVPIFSNYSYNMIKNQINTWTVVVNPNSNDMGTCTAQCYCIINCDDVDIARENFTINWKPKK